MKKTFIFSLVKNSHDGNVFFFNGDAIRLLLFTSQNASVVYARIIIEHKLETQFLFPGGGVRLLTWL